MNNEELQIKFKERLNKLDSQDYDNFETWQILEAFNKAQLQWARRTIGGLGKPQGAPLDEATKQLTDDLQTLLDWQMLRPVEKQAHEELVEFSLPDDYLAFKRLKSSAKTECCPIRPLRLYSATQADADSWLQSETRRPSFAWAETFYTLGGNKVQLYTAGEFQLVNTRLFYYREPRRVEIEGVLDLRTKVESPKDVTCELSNPITELLIDLACGILAGDTENASQYQRAQQQEQLNS